MTNKAVLLLFASVFIFSGCSATYTSPAGSKAIFEQTDIFVSGIGGYDTYRIPAMVVTNKGTILAFCEGRKKSVSDTGDIDLLLRRSTDNGKTWGQMQTIRDDRDNVCGNPCPVVDRKTGTIWLLSTWNLGTDQEWQIIAGKSKDTRRVFITSSNDDGLTWAVPKDITSDVKKTGWTWYATGPGNGIQLEKPGHKGRLIIPCDHIEAETKKYYSHIIYSDDHGLSWHLGGRTPEDMVNECAVVELDNGDLMLNMRNYDRAKTNRAVSVSNDAGGTWSNITHDPILIEPICQASMIKHKKHIVFANPASKDKRIKMTVRASSDSGKTWPMSKLIHPGPSAYSSLTTLIDSSIGLLYEKGKTHPYEKITFARFNLNYLSEDMDCLK